MPGPIGRLSDRPAACQPLPRAGQYPRPVPRARQGTAPPGRRRDATGHGRRTRTFARTAAALALILIPIAAHAQYVPGQGPQGTSGFVIRPFLARQGRPPPSSAPRAGAPGLPGLLGQRTAAAPAQPASAPRRRSRPAGLARAGPGRFAGAARFRTGRCAFRPAGAAWATHAGRVAPARPSHRPRQHRRRMRTRTCRHRRCPTCRPSRRVCPCREAHPTPHPSPPPMAQPDARGSLC